MESLNLPAIVSAGLRGEVLGRIEVKYKASGNVEKLLVEERRCHSKGPPHRQAQSER